LQLELLFENCQSLLSEMRDVTVQVAGNLGAETAAVAKAAEPKQQLEQQLESLETQLKQEKERGARKIQAVRLTCQNLVLHMAKTVKEYFKKTMEDTRREHKKELERARREGIQEGMRRQRHLLQRNMVCTSCNVNTSRLFMCSGCWSACYCGEECQRDHWPTHMETCRGFSPRTTEAQRV
ncbi:unnamed protein product, partial [Porites lobata]